MDDRDKIIKALFLIFLISLPLFFFNLGGMGLTDRDEGSFSEATREMLETGDWLTPKFNYENRFDKPVLIYYIMALSYRIFGVNEIGARFHSAFFGTALLLVIFFFVKSFKGGRTALLSSTILASNLAMVALSRAAITDMVLIFFITASLFSFYKGLWHDRRWHLGFYIFSALAFLTKGPVGVIVPVLVVLPYLILMRGKVNMKGLHPVAGLLLFLAISAPWFLIMVFLHGNSYIEAARYHTLTRYSSVIGGHGGIILYYIPVILFGFFPWSAFLPASLYSAYSAIRESWRRRGEDADRSLMVFCVIWIIVVFLFFTSSRTKLPHYIGPLFPPMAILVAVFLNYYLSKDDIKEAINVKWLKFSLYLLGIIAVMFSAFFLSLFFLSDKINGYLLRENILSSGIELGYAPFLIGVLFLAGTLSFIFFFMKRSRVMAIIISVSMIVLIVLSSLLTIIPKVDAIFLRPQREIATLAGTYLKSGERLIVFGFYSPSLVFYSRRKINFIRDGNIETLRKELSVPGKVLILLRESSGEIMENEKNIELITHQRGYLLYLKDENR